MAEPAQSTPGTDKTPRKVNWIVLGAIAGLIVVAAAAAFFAYRFVEDERQRDLQAWQIRLGIVADSRAAAVSEWIEHNFATLRELTENASLQLYMTELELAQGEKSAVTDEAAQATYLRNLLVATAERTGFKPPIATGEVAANIERAGIAGIGLVDKVGKPIVSTPQMPPLTARMRAAIAKALEGEPSVIDIYAGASNLPTIGFILPILGIQSDQGSAGIGAVVGMRIVGSDLYGRLKQPGATEATAETYLIRAAGGSVEYLSPLADGTEPLKRTLALDTPELDAAFALERPGGFAVKRNYAGEDVLVVSRAISGVPWVLVRTITRGEALARTESRLNTIFTVFVLIIIGVAVTIIAVWRHATSVRAAEAAERFRISSERFQNISKFMRLVTDSQPNAIVAVDGTTTYTFSNEPAARQAGIKAEEMMGKTMAGVMGPVKAKAFAEINARVLREFADFEAQALLDSRERARASHLHTFEHEDGSVEVVKSDHIPLRGDRDHPPGVLMVLSDITELTLERRRSEAMMRQLMNTVVSVVDRRDRFAAHQSARTAEVARAIAGEIGLAADEIKTVDVAASLMHLGKIFVPIEVLGKKEEALTAEERTVLAHTHLVSADLLKDVPFDGPVVTTIRQAGENPDGSGPLGLVGDDILQTARILKVANAFVSRLSPRAHREGMTIDEVSTSLLREAGHTLDRRAVSALINFIENRGGAAKWVHFRDRPAA